MKKTRKDYDNISEQSLWCFNSLKVIIHFLEIDQIRLKFGWTRIKTPDIQPSHPFLDFNNSAKRFIRKAAFVNLSAQTKILKIGQTGALENLYIIHILFENYY